MLRKVLSISLICLFMLGGIFGAISCAEPALIPAETPTPPSVTSPTTQIIEITSDEIAFKIERMQNAKDYVSEYKKLKEWLDSLTGKRIRLTGDVRDIHRLPSSATTTIILGDSLYNRHMTRAEVCFKEPIDEVLVDGRIITIEGVADTADISGNDLRISLYSAKIIKIQ